jgi:hypothetical protein
MWILLASFFLAKITENAVKPTSTDNITVDGNSGITWVGEGDGEGLGDTLREPKA